MYESPIEVVLSDLVSDAVKKADEYIVANVQQERLLFMGRKERR